MAYARLWMVRRLNLLRASNDDLKDVLEKQLGAILEFGVPVWNKCSAQEFQDIERLLNSLILMKLN